MLVRCSVDMCDLERRALSELIVHACIMFAKQDIDIQPEADPNQSWNVVAYDCISLYKSFFLHVR